MNHRIVKVGVVQATPVLFNVEATVAKIVEWIERASSQGVQLLLFPESFIPCYPRGLNFDAVIGKRTELSRKTWLDYWEHSVDLSTSQLDPLKQAIKTAGMFVGLGITEKENIGGSLYCTLVYFDPQGNIVGKHRKIKPTALERYIWGESSGESLVSFDTNIGKIGGLICWENYMPMARMSMYMKGVEIYLAPTADARPAWQSAMQHIALEGRCFVMGANQFVRKQDYPQRHQESIQGEPEIMSAGGSVIIAPTGEILAGPVWNEECLLTAELDFKVLAKSKLDFDVVGHYARKDIFKLTVVDQPDIFRHTEATRSS